MKNVVKRCAMFALAFVMLLSLVACGGEGDDTGTTNAIKTQATTTDDSVKLSKFQQFEQGLTDKGISFEKNDKAAAMVGAKEGYGYIFEDGTSVEVYLFDKDSDSYKEAVKNNKLNLESFGMTLDVVFNDDVCIYFNGTPTHKTDIETVFSDLK